jgi:hypothetical protein
MKNIITAICIIIIASGCTIVYPIPSTSFVKSGTISFPGMKADQIFDATELWFAKTYVDSRAVLEVKNQPGKLFFGNSVHTYHYAGTCSISWRYTTEIKIKDEALHYEISNIMLYKYDCPKISTDVFYYYEYKKAKGFGFSNKWDEMKEKINTDIDENLKSLETQVKSYSNPW